MRQDEAERVVSRKIGVLGIYIRQSVTVITAGHPLKHQSQSKCHTSQSGYDTPGLSSQSEPGLVHVLQWHDTMTHLSPMSKGKPRSLCCCVTLSAEINGPTTSVGAKGAEAELKVVED